MLSRGGASALSETYAVDAGSTACFVMTSIPSPVGPANTNSATLVGRSFTDALDWVEGAALERGEPNLTLKSLERITVLIKADPLHLLTESP
jgi:hypothetical protein